MHDAHKKQTPSKQLGRKSSLACMMGILLLVACCFVLIASPLYAEESGAQKSSDAAKEQVASFRANAGWVKSPHGWWYRYADGTWPANTSLKIDGKTYRFNAKG